METDVWKCFDRYMILLPKMMEASHPINTLTSVHLKTMEIEFSNLLKKSSQQEFQWVLNPMVKYIKMQHHLISLQKQLIAIREDRNFLAKKKEKKLKNHFCVICGWDLKNNIMV